MKTIAENATDFADLRTRGNGSCIYVDKTDYFYRLATNPGCSLFFIARPRRFGKSLMITTFKYIFGGRRELFQGLKIDKADYDWKVHPVIHLDFSLCAQGTYAGFMAQMPDIVKSAINASGYAYDDSKVPSVNFLNAIEWHFAQGRPCVVLIDEYDDPVARSLANPDDAEKIRDELAGFYGKIKSRTHAIRFLMITGVSKFTKMSVFSALSNLTDISALPEYAAMLGYTEGELDEYFGGHLAAHAKVMGLTDADYRAELKRWYNGYRFSAKNPITVYNPVSLGVTLAHPDDEFHGTWTATGRPSMLMNYIKREGLLAMDFEKGVRVGEDAFDVSDIRHLRAVGMLYQTGYLTIGDYRHERYLLKIPDEEVRRDLLLLVASQAAEEHEGWVGTMCDNLEDGKFERFFAGLKSLYAHLPYGAFESDVYEANFECALVVLFRARGFDLVAEDMQAVSRADLVVTGAEGIYIFELKRDESAAAALAQIKEKGYADPYRARGLPIWGIGLSFDSKTLQLTDADSEQLG